jgi:hypothetical protein
LLAPSPGSQAGLASTSGVDVTTAMPPH